MKARRAPQAETTKNLSLTSSKSEGFMGPTTAERGQASRVIGLFIGTGLLGFWFGVGAALGAKMVNSLEERISIK